MTFKEYIDNLNKLVKEHPHVVKYDVIYSIDDEGNDYRDVIYKPTIGYYDGEDFLTTDIEFEDQEINEPNVVCIN